MKFDFSISAKERHADASTMMNTYTDIKTRTGVSLFGVKGYATAILSVEVECELYEYDVCVITASDDTLEDVIKFLNATFNTVAKSVGLTVGVSDINLASYCYASTINETCPFTRHQLALAKFFRYKKDDYEAEYREDVIKKVMEKLSILAVGCRLVTTHWIDNDGNTHEVIASEEFVTNGILGKQLSEFLSLVNKSGFSIGGTAEYSAYVHKVDDSEVDVYAVAAFYFVTNYNNARPVVENMFTALASLHYYLLNIA